MRGLEFPSVQEKTHHQSCLQVELAASLAGELPGTGNKQHGEGEEPRLCSLLAV